MSGIFEQLLEKADVLIAALNENTKARLAGDAAPAADKPAVKRGANKAADKPADTGPKTTEAELVAKFEELKATDTEKRMPALKKIIADLGFASLKELRVTPPKFDEAMEKLQAYEATLAAEPAAEDDDL